MEVEEADQGPSRVISTHEVDVARVQRCVRRPLHYLEVLFGFENQELLVRKLACSFTAFQRAFVLLHNRHVDTLEVSVDGAWFKARATGSLRHTTSSWLHHTCSTPPSSTKFRLLQRVSLA